MDEQDLWEHRQEIEKLLASLSTPGKAPRLGAVLDQIMGRIRAAHEAGLKTGKHQAEREFYDGRRS